MSKFLKNGPEPQKQWYNKYTLFYATKFINLESIKMIEDINESKGGLTIWTTLVGFYLDEL